MAQDEIGRNVGEGSPQPVAGTEGDEAESTSQKLLLCSLDAFRKYVDVARDLRHAGELAIMFRRAGAKVAYPRQARLTESLERAGVSPPEFATVLHSEIIWICAGLITGKVMEPDRELFGELSSEDARQWREKAAYVEKNLIDDALRISFRVNSTTCLPLLEGFRYQVLTEEPDEWRGGAVRTVVLELQSSVGVPSDGGRSVQPVLVECGPEELRYVKQCVSRALEEIDDEGAGGGGKRR